MKNTILILIIAFTSLTSCKNEPKEKKETGVIERKTVKVKKVDNTEKINQVFEHFESLYKELIKFKDNSNFKKYGFGKGGKNYEWLNKVRKFKSNPDSKLLLKKGVLIGELEQLGMAYANSKGKETEVTKTFNKIFSDVISSNTETKSTETQKKILPKQIISKSWYKGGNLHKGNGTDWKKATEHNKLATCADFVMIIAKRKDETPSVFSSEFKKASESLKNCVDQFYKLSGSESTTVSKAAIGCL
jgi:hypothetical protein|tara:strand:+ start:964 stop:1701 length:738 start_codon:yes stop_codon:yes gene_type:complete